MKTHRTLRVLTRSVLLLSTFTTFYVVQLSTALGQGTAFTYQGQLVDGGFYANGFYDLEFTLYNDAVSGSAFGVLTNTATEVADGLFTVSLDFGSGVFDGSDRWLEIGAVTNGGGAFTILTPRQPITSAPYAIKAANAMTVTMGTISDPSFLGTTTTVPLELQVNNTGGLRLEYPTLGSVPNLVGGFSSNSVGAGTEGAVIAGGGSSGNANSIGLHSDYSAIGGGVNNTIVDNSWYATIAGGQGNDIGVNSSVSAIGGGDNNTIADYSGATTIGGGSGNTIASNSFAATIAGGFANDIGVNSDYSAIGGGVFNTIASNSFYATIPGGRENDVGANAFYAFAAGHRAKANHTGTFVWADSQSSDFASTANNQFLIRASGGVGIGKSNPATALDVNGTITANAFVGDGSGLTGLPDGHSLDASDGSPANALYVDADGDVGIGTTTPSGDLQIQTPNSVNASFRMRSGTGWYLILNQSPSSVFSISNGGQDRLTIEPGGDIGIGTANPTEKLHVVGNIYATGTITPSSDRNLKKNFNPVNALEVLERVSLLPIQQWTYKAEADAVRHVGPMAQDFHAAFGYGANDVTIATVDADGVALAAIQGLNQKLTDELQRRDTENAELKARLTALEILIANLHTEGK